MSRCLRHDPVRPAIPSPFVAGEYSEHRLDLRHVSCFERGSMTKCAERLVPAVEQSDIRRATGQNEVLNQNLLVVDDVQSPIDGGTQAAIGVDRGFEVALHSA